MSTGKASVSLALLVVGLLSTAPAALAATIEAPSCSQADVQAAVDGASDGDVVTIPAGTCSWQNHVSWENKDVWVRGAGIGQTLISRDGEFIFYVVISDAGKGSHRISDLTLTGDVVTSVIYITSASLAAVPSGRWRIDHLRFEFPTGQRSGVHVTGVNYGVIDHNTFNWRDGVAIRHAFFLSDECYGGSPLAGDFANQQPLDFGSDKFVFAEDNDFVSNDNRPVIAYDSSAGGGRIVFRYNTVTGGFFYNHWTRGCELAAQAGEIYNNRFIGTDAYGYPSTGYPMRLEAGTWLIHHNYAASFHAEGATTPYVHLDDRRAVGPEGTLGQCDGTQPWDGNAGDPAAPGWPCLGQIGRAPGKSFAQIQAGDKPESAPVYLWNNGTEPGCATGGGCSDNWGVYADPAAYIKDTPHPNGEVDYVNANTPMPGYEPYTYPHPLAATGGQPTDRDDAGCGCTLGSRQRGSLAAVVGALGALALLGRRRRRPR
jgi:hypothetical protein